MSYAIARDGRLKEQVHFVGMAGRSRVRTSRGTRRVSGMGGIFGGVTSLGSVGSETLSFEAGALAARAALVALAAAGTALEQSATTATTAGIGTEVREFATGGAWRGLARAIEALDVNKLRSLQDQIRSVTSVAIEALRTTAVDRFLLAFINPPAAVMPRQSLDMVKELIETPPPGFPDVGKGMPWYFWAAFGGFFFVTAAIIIR